MMFIRQASFAVVLRGCCIGAVVLLSGIAFCQAGEPEASGARFKTPEQRIEAALHDTTNLEFVETPLSDVVDFLKELHKLEIQLDSAAMDAASIGSDTPITRNLKNVSLAAALKHLLGPLGLTYVVQDEVLLITTTEAAQRMQSARVYNVKDLVEGQSAAALAEVLLHALTDVVPASSGTPTQGTAASPPGTHANAAQAAATQPSAGKPHVNVFLIEPFGESLVVRANYRGHKDVERLLLDLRRSASAVQTMPAAPATPAVTR